MKLGELKKVSYPEKITEALKILAGGDKGVSVVAGGVSFVFAPLAGVTELVSLSRLPLDYIKKQNGDLRIGATTRISDLARSSEVRGYARGILADACGRIGSTLNRNLITIGGNLVQPFIWSDLSTVAVALGARFKLQKHKSSRTVPAEKFFSRVPRQIMRQGELLTEIVFPSPPRNARTAYEKFTLTENDFAYLKTAVVLTRSGKTCKAITIAVGGATLLPQRCPEAEKVLKGKTASQILVNEASEVAAEEIKVARDIRCSREYKRDLCRAQVRGILERILLDQKVAEWKLF